MASSRDVGGTARLAIGLVLLLCAYGISEVASATAATWTGQAESPLRRYPLWALVHFGSAAVFVSLVPFQLAARLRRRYPRLHRYGGRLAFTAAIVMAVTGLALSYTMPERPLPVRTFFTVVSTTFLAFTALAVGAIRSRDFAAHRRWVSRMTATALAALTHRLISPLFVMQGYRNMDDFWSVFLTAGWIAWGAHLAATEWWLARTTPSRAPAERAGLPPLGLGAGSSAIMGH